MTLTQGLRLWTGTGSPSPCLNFGHLLGILRKYAMLGFSSPVTASSKSWVKWDTLSHGTHLNQGNWDFFKISWWLGRIFPPFDAFFSGYLLIILSCFCHLLLNVRGIESDRSTRHFFFCMDACFDLLVKNADIQKGQIRMWHCGNISLIFQ